MLVDDRADPCEIGSRGKFIAIEIASGEADPISQRPGGKSRPGLLDGVGKIENRRFRTFTASRKAIVHVPDCAAHVENRVEAQRLHLRHHFRGDGPGNHVHRRDERGPIGVKPADARLPRWQTPPLTIQASCDQLRTKFML